MHVFNRSPADASSQAGHESDSDEETSKDTQKEEGLEADVAKHSSKLKAVAARPIILHGEFSPLQSKLGALSKRQLQMDTTRAVEREIFAAAKADFEQGITGVQKRYAAELSRSFIDAKFGAGLSPCGSVILATRVSFVLLLLCCKSVGRVGLVDEKKCLNERPQRAGREIQESGNAS